MVGPWWWRLPRQRNVITQFEKLTHGARSWSLSRIESKCHPLNSVVAFPFDPYFLRGPFPPHLQDETRFAGAMRNAVCICEPLRHDDAVPGHQVINYGSHGGPVLSGDSKCGLDILFNRVRPGLWRVSL